MGIEISGNDFAWMAGGPQGSGVDAAANIFGRACCYGGLYVYGKREYHSNIKGLHSYFHIRVSRSEVRADVERVDMLNAFDAETVVRHIQEMAPDGTIICNTESLATRMFDIPTLSSSFWVEWTKKLQEKEIEAKTVNDLLERAKESNITVCPIPYSDLLREVGQKIGEEKLSRLTRMTNVLALGVSFGLLGYDKAFVDRAIGSVFGGRQRIIDMNLVALNLAYDYAVSRFHRLSIGLNPVKTGDKRIFIQGTQAVALGKLLGGCRIQTYYPITPAADESEYLEENEIFETLTENKEGSIVVMQTEDEIAAVNMASGAALTGARAATATSGPGFSLMVEGLGWAGNNETPLVVTFYQRAGPGTGMATRHGQSDLRFAIYAAHGEFPRIVLSSGDIEECFYDATRAFDYAERYQMPVIHLIDKALANSSGTCKMFELGEMRIERGQLLNEEDVKGQEYRRFQFTDSGISPRLPLGTAGTVFWNTGYEHSDLGHINEEPINRTLMIAKRMRKLETVDREISVQERVNFFGAPDSPAIVISWGSPKGAVLEVLELLKEEGYEISFLQIRMLHPLPKQYLAEILSKAKKKIIVEGNYEAQLAGLIREQTGIEMDHFVLKWSGRPMYVGEVHDALRMIMQEKAPTRQVVTSGA